MCVISRQYKSAWKCEVEICKYFVQNIKGSHLALKLGKNIYAIIVSCCSCVFHCSPEEWVGVIISRPTLWKAAFNGRISKNK